MAKVKEDISRVRVLVDGKQGINELGKLEMEAKEYKHSLAQITEEQKKFEKEAQKLDKARERYDKLVAKAKELEAANKQGTATYTRTQASITKVTAEIQKAQQASVSLKDAQARYNQESAKLTETNAKLKALRTEMGVTGMTMRQLRQHQRDLRNEIYQSTTKGTSEYKRLKAELLQVNSAIRTQRAELNGTQGFFGGMGKSLKGFGVMALGAFGITAGLNTLRTALSSSLQKNVEFSDSLSDVQKTTGLTNNEIDRLNDSLKTFNTRTPRAELLGLAEIAGRLGIKGVKDIEGFVRAADMINVSLGDALGDPEEVMRDLGKLTDTFGVKDAYGIEDSLLRVGSAINELGMASTANEGYMVDFAKRLGGVAPLAKISIQDILGLGATLDSLGQTSEVSSTALSKLFISMAKNADTYAKYAKMEVTDFVKLLNEDANEAFIRSLEGVKDNAAGITELTATLGDLGEDGGRVVGVLGSLANNTEKLRNQQDLAAKAFKEGTSVIDEFAIKNENLAANYAKITNWYDNLLLNKFTSRLWDEMIGKFARWITTIDEATEAHKKLEREVNKLDTELPSLMDQYQKLSTATNLNEEDQEKLKDAIQKVGELVPTAITEFDKYGNAMSINAEKVREFTDAQRAALQILNEDAINENEEHLTRLGNQIAKVKDQLNRRDSDGDIFMTLDVGRGMVQNLKLTTDQVRALKEELNALEQKSEGYRTIISNLKGEPVGSASADDAAAAAAEAQRKAADEEAKRLAAIEAEKAKERAEKAKAEYEKAKQSYKKFLTDIADLEEERRVASLDKDSQDIIKIESKYESMLEKARDYHSKKLISDEAFAILETNLIDLQNQERDALIKEQSDKIKEDRKKLIDEVAFLQMTAEEQELERVRVNYENRIIEAQKFGLQTIELEELREAELAEIRKKYKEKEEAEKQADLDRINQATMSEKELALIENERYYDELIRLAEKHNIDITEIEQARADATNDITKDALDKDYQEYLENLRKKQELVMAFGDIVTNSMGAIAAITGNMNAFEKETALFKAAVNTGVAISNIVAAFSAKSITPIDFAIKVATGIATVMANVGTAITTIKGAKEPARPDVSGSGSGATRQQGRAATASAKPVSSYYQGGDTSNTGLGFGDRYGEYAGYVHKDEYVVPSFIRSHPYVADVLPAIEAIRKEKIRGFYKGGETSKPSKPSIVPSSGADPEMLALMRELVKKMDAMPTRIKAYLVDSELEEFREKRDMLKKKYVK